MARLAYGLFLAAMLTAAAPAWPHAEARRAHAGAPPAHVSYAPRHAHASAPLHIAQPFRVGPPFHAPLRPAVFVSRPVVTTYLPSPLAPRVAVLPSPYYVVVGAGYTGTDLAYPAEPNWNWTPVASVAELAGRGQMRYYCPDTRSYYPDAQACPSPWLRVVP